MELDRALPDFRRKRATVVGISVDPPATSARLARRLRLRFALLSDEKLEVAMRYGVAMRGRDIALPAVFIIDARRRVQFRQIAQSAIDRPSTAALLAHLP